MRARAPGAVLACALGLLTGSSSARADIAPLQTHADDVTLDARLRELELRGNVRVDSAPFHLSSDALRLRRTSLGVEVDGTGRLAFCKCLGTPLAIRFGGAIVAPPGDLLLKHPRLEIWHVPVLWLPYFWLRSPERFGLLPPELAYRGADGVFAGGGLHVPWGPSEPSGALDLRAGAYLRGGSALMMDLRTPSSQTRLRVDHLETSGLLADARGAAERDGETLSWDLDLLRGERGVRSTTELERAARVYDRARVDAHHRVGGWTFGAAIRTTQLRGGALSDLGAAGPMLTVRHAEALGGIGAYDATVSGGALHAGPSTLAYARGVAGGTIAGHLGAVGASVSLRAAGNAASDGERRGGDGAVRARAELGLPLVKSLSAADPSDPWRHRIEPRIGVAALAAQGHRVLAGDIAAARGFGGIGGGAWVVDAGGASALGRWGRNDGLEASLSAGAVGDDADAEPVLRWRTSATFRPIGLGAEGAHLVRATRSRRYAEAPPLGAPLVGGAPSAREGHAVLLRARFGPLDRVHLSANVAGRVGIDPVVARLLTDAPLEPSSGFLAAPGWTGGARLSLPFSRAVITRGGVDADLSEPLLLAARGSVELRDACECIALRATGSRRIGREGVDVWITVDLAPASPVAQLKSLTQ